MTLYVLNMFLFPYCFFPSTVAAEDHTDNDCLLIVMMTHGGRDNTLKAFDASFHVSMLWERFVGEECITLIGKPKLFILQNCRGSHIDRVNPEDGGTEAQVTVDGGRNLPDKRVALTSTADQLIMYATPDGNAAMRDTITGSWLIQELCQQLELKITDDFLSILTDVNRKVALKEVERDVFDGLCSDAEILDLVGAKQIPVVVHSLRKKLFFNDSGADRQELIPTKVRTNLISSQMAETNQTSNKVEMSTEDQQIQSKLDYLLKQIAHTSQQNKTIMQSLQRQNESLEALKADIVTIKKSRDNCNL